MNIQELILFNTACEEFANGKYILADAKILSILKIIENDEKIKDIVRTCCEGYNFPNAYNNAVEFKNDEAFFSIPKEDKEIIAFVYHLLSSFENNSINLYDFLQKFYSIDNSPNNFVKFANGIIEPFKEAVNSVYSKRHILVESEDYQNNIYNKIKTTINLILNSMDNYKLDLNAKEEFTMLLNSLYLASEKNDKKLVYSLMIGVDYFTKAYKKSRVAYLSLEECFT